MSFTVLLADLYSGLRNNPKAPTIKKCLKLTSPTTDIPMNEASHDSQARIAANLIRGGTLLPPYAVTKRSRNWASGIEKCASAQHSTAQHSTAQHSQVDSQLDELGRDDARGWRPNS